MGEGVLCGGDRITGIVDRFQDNEGTDREFQLIHHSYLVNGVSRIVASVMSFLVPSYIKYWINSIPKPSCALFSGIEDVREENTLHDILVYAENGKVIPNLDNCKSFESLIRCTISHLAEQYGWNNLPPVLKGNTTANMIALGHAEETLCLLEVLYRVSCNLAIKPNEARAVTRDTRTEASKASESINPVPSALTERSGRQREESSTGDRDRGRAGRHISFGENSTKFISYSDEDTLSPVSERRARGNLEVEAPPPPPPPPHSQDPQQPRVASNTGSLPRRASSSTETERGWSDMDLVFSPEEMRHYNSQARSAGPPAAHGLSSEERVKIIQWLSTLGISARPRPDSPPQTTSPSARRPLDLEDEWANGVLLSELAAACSRGNRGEVKEVGMGPVVRVLQQWPGSQKVPTGIGDPMDCYKRVVVSGSLAKATGKPRLMLVGTELLVKSRAQAIRNTEISLKSLSIHAGLEDLELILPSDLLNGRRSLWPVLAVVHRVFGTEPPQSRKSRGGSSSRPRSVGTVRRTQVSRSMSPKRGSAARDRQQQRSRSPAPEPRSSGSRVRSASPSHRVVARPLPAVVRKVSFRSRTPSPARRNNSSKHDLSVAIAQHSQSPSRRDPGYTARRSTRSASPPRRRLNTPAVSTGSPARGRTVSRQSTDDKENVQSRNTEVGGRSGRSMGKTLSGEAKKELERGWDSSWSQEDRNQLWNAETRLDRGVRPLGKDAVQVAAGHNVKKKALTSYKGHFGRRSAKPKGSKTAWQPPSLSEMDQQAANLAALPPILPPQQSAIRDWLFTIGFSVHDGEGGFLHWSGTSCASLPRLKDDRIRNGELLCDLVATLEPNAAAHAQLMQLVNRKPSTIPCALENIERALWLLRIRKCPPIPQVYLCQPMAIIEANKSLLWGLLQEIMQAYPLVPTNGGKCAVSLQSDQPIVHGTTWCNSLPYSITDRKALDQSLMQWLVEEEILSGIMKGLLPADMPSIATLEGPLRDGTMLCLLAGKILGSPVLGWNRKARSFSTSVANLRKCTRALRGSPNMSLRFLYNGVEEDIAKGEWSAILGLLEDMHRLRDGVAPVKDHSEFPHRRESRRPYLGYMSQEWPPPMSANDTGASRKFAVSSPPQRVTSSVDLAHNVPPVAMDVDRIRISSCRPEELQAQQPASRDGPLSTRWNISATDNGRKSDIDLFPGHSVRLCEGRPAYAVSTTGAQDLAVQFDHNRERYYMRGSGETRATGGDMFPSYTFADGVVQSAKEEEGNAVRELRMRYQQQHQAPGRRDGDVIPTGSEPHGGTLPPQPPPREYSEPEWTQQAPALDIAPDPRSIPGGMSVSRASVGDILPSSLASSKQIQEMSTMDNAEGLTGSSFGFRGPPKAGQLRVQAATSRYAENVPVNRLKGECDGDEGVLDNSPGSPAPSPLRRMRENYQRECRDVANKRPPRVYRDEAEKKVAGAGSLFRGEEAHTPPPPWVQELDPVQAHVKMAPEDAPYDDAVSVGSTPPAKNSGSEGALRMAAAGVLDAKRIKSSALAFRWLSGLGIVPPGIPTLEVRRGGEATIPSFTDGVIWGKLYQHLERVDPIPGFTLKPRNRAQRLQNIRKVLQALSAKKSIPLSSLAVEEDLLDGRADAVVNLLLRIRDVYKLQRYVGTGSNGHVR